MWNHRPSSTLTRRRVTWSTATAWRVGSSVRLRRSRHGRLYGQLIATLCAAAWLIGAEVLALFGSYFGKNLGTYGALGSVLVLMLWMKVMSQVLFFGAELCKVVYTRSHGL